MKTAKKLLSPAQVGRIRSAIAQVEKQTSCEIVVALIGQCHPYHRTRALAGLIVFGLYTLVSMMLSPLTLGMLITHVAWGLALSAATYFLLPYSEFLMRATTRLVRGSGLFAKTAEVKAAALFKGYQLDKTELRNGVILFGSLLEHSTLVYGDQGINQYFQKAEWSQIAQVLATGLQTGDGEKITQAYLQALQMILQKVQNKFPVSPNDVNELPNHVIIQ